MGKKFQPGNPGKPKGAKNKRTVRLRNTIEDFLSDNFGKVQEDFLKLTPKDRLHAYCDLLKYGLPTAPNITMNIDFEDLSQEQVEQIIEALPDKKLDKLIERIHELRK